MNNFSMLQDQDPSHFQQDISSSSPEQQVENNQDKSHGTVLDLLNIPQVSQDLVCQHCRQVFTKRSHVFRHFREKHQQMRQYACTYENCDRKFKRGSHLKRHMISHTHEKKFKCLNCIMQFGYKHHLERHIKIVHEKKLFTCEDCGEGFTKKRGLSKHIKEQHTQSTKKTKKSKKIHKNDKTHSSHTNNQPENSEDQSQKSQKQQIFQQQQSQGHPNQINRTQQVNPKTQINDQQNNITNNLLNQTTTPTLNPNQQLNKHEQSDGSANIPNTQTQTQPQAKIQIQDLLSSNKTKLIKKTSSASTNNAKNKTEIELYRCTEPGCLNAYKKRYMLKVHMDHKHKKQVAIL